MRPEDSRRPAQHGDRPPLSHHILPTAGTMIGICTGLVGLAKLLETQSGESQLDEMSGLIAVVFLVSAILSYLALRLSHHPAASRRLDVGADLVFMGGLLALGALTLLFAYDRL